MPRMQFLQYAADKGWPCVREVIWEIKARVVWEMQRWFQFHIQYEFLQEGKESFQHAVPTLPLSSWTKSRNSRLMSIGCSICIWIKYEATSLSLFPLHFVNTYHLLSSNGQWAERFLLIREDASATSCYSELSMISQSTKTSHLCSIPLWNLESRGHLCSSLSISSPYFDDQKLLHLVSNYRYKRIWSDLHVSLLLFFLRNA